MEELDKSSQKYCQTHTRRHGLTGVGPRILSKRENDFLPRFVCWQTESLRFDPSRCSVFKDHCALRRGREDYHPTRETSTHPGRILPDALLPMKRAASGVLRAARGATGLSPAYRWASHWERWLSEMVCIPSGLLIVSPSPTGVNLRSRHAGAHKDISGPLPRGGE